MQHCTIDRTLSVKAACRALHHRPWSKILFKNRWKHWTVSIYYSIFNLHLSVHPPPTPPKTNKQTTKNAARTASNERFMDLSETLIQKQIWNQWLRSIPQRPNDRVKLTYQVLIKYFEKFSFYFGLGASLNTSVSEKCGGCFPLVIATWIMHSFLHFGINLL